MGNRLDDAERSMSSHREQAERARDKLSEAQRAARVRLDDSERAHSALARAVDDWRTRSTSDWRAHVAGEVDRVQSDLERLRREYTEFASQSETRADQLRAYMSGQMSDYRTATTTELQREATARAEQDARLSTEAARLEALVTRRSAEIASSAGCAGGAAV